MDTSVVICTYNRAQSLRRTLESLRQMSVPAELEWELIVVDNNSTDDTRAVFEEFAQVPGLTVRYMFESRQGLSHARNRGVLSAQGDVISFLDDDVLVAPDWIAQVMDAFQEFDPACVGGRVLLNKNLPLPDWWSNVFLGPAGVFDRGNLNLLCPASDKELAGIGANISFCRSVFQRYGLFDPKLGRRGKTLLMGEEVDLVDRLKRKNERVLYFPSATVFHNPDLSRFTRHYARRWSYHMGMWEREAGWIPTGPRHRLDRIHRTIRSCVAVPLLRLAGNRRRSLGHEMVLSRALGRFVAGLRRIRLSPREERAEETMEQVGTGLDQT